MDLDKILNNIVADSVALVNRDIINLIEAAVFNGAVRYGPNNHVIDNTVENEVGKALGHIAKYQAEGYLEEGKETDSGLPHLAHAASRLIAALVKEESYRGNLSDPLYPFYVAHDDTTIYVYAGEVAENISRGGDGVHGRGTVADISKVIENLQLFFDNDMTVSVNMKF